MPNNILLGPLKGSEKRNTRKDKIREKRKRWPFKNGGHNRIKTINKK